MLNIIFVYIVLLFLVLRFSVTLFNFLSNPKLGKYGKHFTDKVSIIIEHTADTAALAELLKALQQQDYQHIEILIGNGESEYNAALEAFCAGDRRFRLLAQDANGADEADGSFLLFLQENTRVHQGLINSLIYRSKVFNLALLNIIPTLVVSGLANYSLLPLNNFVLLNLIPIRLVRLFPGPAFVAGSSECMFFNAAVYKKYNWRHHGEGQLRDGADVVRAVKQENLKVETLLGDRLIYHYVPENGKSLFYKTGRHLLRSFGNNIIAAFVYLLLVVAGPLVMLANSEYNLLVLPIGLIFLSRVMISFLSRQNPVWNVLLHPLQMVMLAACLLTAIYTRFIQLISSKG